MQKMWDTETIKEVLGPGALEKLAAALKVKEEARRRASKRVTIGDVERLLGAAAAETVLKQIGAAKPAPPAPRTPGVPATK